MMAMMLIACLCMFSGPHTLCRAESTVRRQNAGIYARLQCQKFALSSSFGGITWRLRGGTGGPEDLRPADIMEIGGNVLKMWEVSLKETEEDMALAAKRKKIEDKLPAQQAQSFVRDELDAKRPPLSAAESAGGVTEGPAQIFGEEGLSAQDVIRKLRTAAQQHGDDDQKKVATPEEVSAGRGRASLPSVVTWNHVHLVGTSTSNTTKKRENEQESLISGAVTEVSESAISPSGSSATLRLPSVITWTTPRRTTFRHTPPTEEGTREEEERRRREERRASEEIALANLNTLKAHLGQAKGLVNELKDRRADAEAQLSEMEEELSKQQRAANMR